MGNLAALLQHETQQRFAVLLGRERDADLVQLLDFPTRALKFPLKLGRAGETCRS